LIFILRNIKKRKTEAAIGMGFCNARFWRKRGVCTIDWERIREIELEN
jgi:hypothetical protein